MEIPISKKSDIGLRNPPITFGLSIVVITVQPCATARLTKCVRYIESPLYNDHYSDVELLQCELREKWEEVNFCDFRESDFGGLCSVTLKRSYIAEGDGEATNTTVTENLASLFADKIVESFGEKRMASFLDINSNDKLAYNFLVGARTDVRLNMRTIMAIVLFNYTFNLVLTHDRPENETFGKPRTEADIEFSKEESELYQIAEAEPQHSERVLQRSVAVTNSKYPKAVTENPKAEPGPQYSAIDYHVRVIAYLRCRGSPVAGQLVELRKKDKPKDKLLDRRDTDKNGMVDLGGHDDDDDGIESYISIKHTCHPRPSCVYCTSKFKVPQEHTCKGPCPEDKYWGAGIELTAYECHCHQPRKALKYWRDE
ncbi:transthyretin-like family domain-containing protein [Ditylenchus destructor]|nr:transthyretin-like family domain-containing protein [Ditylenchus destructor]